MLKVLSQSVNPSSSAIRARMKSMLTIPFSALREASDHKYQLTSQSLREILEVAQSTINSFASEVSRNGFLLKRVGPGKWRVYRDEEVVD